jgi:hypothetical protein
VGGNLGTAGHFPENQISNLVPFHYCMVLFDIIFDINVIFFGLLHVRVLRIHKYYSFNGKLLWRRARVGLTVYPPRIQIRAVAAPALFT